MGWVPEVGELVVFGNTLAWLTPTVARVLEINFSSNDAIQVRVGNENSTGWVTLGEIQPFDLHDPERLEEWLAS